MEDMANDPIIEQSSRTVGEWLDTWMQEYKRKSIRPSTYASYYHNIEKHIRPALGNIEIHSLRSEQIQKLLNKMGKAHGKQPALAPWSILKTKNILSGAMEQAVRNRILIINPVKATVPPKLEQKEIRVLSGDEQNKFMDACKGHRLEALFLFALATGMRRGEILALTWDSVDFVNQSISVKKSMSRVKDPDTGVTELMFSEPKSKSGRRKVPMLDNMVPVLREHLVRQEDEKRLAGSAWNPRNLVFCSTVGTPIEPRRVRTTLDKIVKRAGLSDLTFHALRHTFATRMLENEVPAKVVQDVIGHANVTLTLNTYSHVLESTAHQQMSKINTLFGRDSTESQPKPQKNLGKPDKTEPLKPKKPRKPER